MNGVQQPPTSQLHFFAVGQVLHYNIAAMQDLIPKTKNRKKES
jgi:hypothetical protein